MAEVSMNALTKQFGDLTVLDRISLTVASGEFLTLLGPSGCGKSTLLRIIAGLETPTNGGVHISGRSVNRVRPKDRNIAMVFQSYALYPHLSVFDNIAMPLRMRTLSFFERSPVVGPMMPGRKRREKEIRKKVRETASLLGIHHLLNRKPSQISGGQRQRVALGRAMVRNPKVFLMDEPLSNLDAKLRVHMRTEISELHRALSSTFIYVTHDQAEAMTMSDRIALMIDGTLLQVDTPTEIYGNPGHLKVAEFIGNPKINLIPGILEDSGRVVSCRCPLPVDLKETRGQEISVGVRPEALKIVEAFQPGWAGRVSRIEHLGAYFLVHVLLAGGDQTVILRAGTTEMAVPRPGKELRLGASPENLLFFGDDGERLHSRSASERTVRYA